MGVSPSSVSRECLEFCMETLKQEGKMFSMDIPSAIKEQKIDDFNQATNRVCYMYNCGFIEMATASLCTKTFLSVYTGSKELVRHWMQRPDSNLCCIIAGSPLVFAGFCWQMQLYLRKCGFPVVPVISNVSLCSVDSDWKVTLRTMMEILREGRVLPLSVSDIPKKVSTVVFDSFEDSEANREAITAVSTADVVFWMNPDVCKSFLRGKRMANCMKSGCILFYLDSHGGIETIGEDIKDFPGSYLLRPKKINIKRNASLVKHVIEEFGEAPLQTSNVEFFVWQKA